MEGARGFLLRVLCASPSRPLRLILFRSSSTPGKLALNEPCQRLHALILEPLILQIVEDVVLIDEPRSIKAPDDRVQVGRRMRVAGMEDYRPSICRKVNASA